MPQQATVTVSAEALIAVLEKYGISWQAFNRLETAVDHALYDLTVRDVEAETRAAYEFHRDQLAFAADRSGGVGR